MFNPEDSRRNLYTFPAQLTGGTERARPLRFHIGDFAELVVSYMPRPDLTGLTVSSQDSVSSAATDLYNLMRTSTLFFYPAAEALWESSGNLTPLLWVLQGGRGPAVKAKRPLTKQAGSEFERDIKSLL